MTIDIISNDYVILPRRREPNGKNNVRRRRIRLLRTYIYIYTSVQLYIPLPGPESTVTSESPAS